MSYLQAIEESQTEKERLKAENKRLREALVRIADLPTLSAPLSWGIARDALQRAGTNSDNGGGE